MPFSHDVPLANRLGQLLNNAFTADTFFVVGSSHRLVFGHRNILSVGSPVFDAQLNGDFDEARHNSIQNPIVVSDVEHGIFLQILRHIYCEDAIVNSWNVVDLYYASRKYLLTRLSESCERFLRDSLCSLNVMKIFNDNRKYEFEEVNDACLEKICDNPLALLTSNNFAFLHRTSLELIVASKKINCTEEQLLDAVSNWGKVHRNESTLSLELAVLKQKHRTLKCRKLYGFDDFSSCKSPDIYLKIKTDKKIAIYGIGVYVGGSGLEGFRADVKVSVEVRLRSSHQDDSLKSVMQSYNGTKKVEVKEDLYVQDILFEKMFVSPNEVCVIFGKIKLKTSSIKPMFCLRQFKPYDLPRGVNISVRDSFGSNNNCVAYVFFNVL